MKFKANEIVLIENGHGTFVVRKITQEFINGTYNITNGYYSTNYQEKDIHKCPTSIKKLLKGVE
jgi:DNA-binding GntR family transcriptional regulator